MAIDFFFISQMKYAVVTHKNYLNETVSFELPKGLLNTMDKEIFRIYLSIKLFMIYLGGEVL